MFISDKIRDNSSTPYKVSNSYESPFCIIIYASYKISKMVRFSWPTRYLHPLFTGYMLEFQWIKLLYTYTEAQKCGVCHVLFICLVIKADQIPIRYLLFTFVCVC